MTVAKKALRTPAQKKKRRANEKGRWAGWKKGQRERKAPKGKVRHYKDGNPANTSSSNVEFLSRKEHSRKHKRLGNAGGRRKKKKKKRK